MSPRKSIESDGLWWVLSGVGGIGSVLAGRFIGALDSIAIGIVYLIVPVGIPAVLGYFRPVRPWRWALACFLVNRLVVAPGILQEGASTAFWIFSLLLVLPLNLAGAHLGYILNRHKAVPAGTFQTSRLSRIASRAAVSGLVLGGAVFLIGFFGPLILAPTAAQGPLVGFLFAPPAAVLGLVLGGIAGGVESLTQRQFLQLLAGAAFLCAVSLLLMMALAD